MKGFLADTSGAAGVEYGILIAAVAAVIIVAAFAIGHDINTAFGHVEHLLNATCGRGGAGGPCGPPSP